MWGGQINMSDISKRSTAVNNLGMAFCTLMNCIYNLVSAAPALPESREANLTDRPTEAWQQLARAKMLKLGWRAKTQKKHLNLLSLLQQSHWYFARRTLPMACLSCE